jgi:hypothetical protein
MHSNNCEASHKRTNKRNTQKKREKRIKRVRRKLKRKIGRERHFSPLLFFVRLRLSRIFLWRLWSFRLVYKKELGFHFSKWKNVFQIYMQTCRWLSGPIIYITGGEWKALFKCDAVITCYKKQILFGSDFWKVSLGIRGISTPSDNTWPLPKYSCRICRSEL